MPGPGVRVVSKRRSENTPSTQTETAAPMTGLSPVALVCALAALFAAAAALPGLLDPSGWDAFATADAQMIDADRPGHPALAIAVDASSALLSAAATLLAAGIALDRIRSRD